MVFLLLSMILAGIALITGSITDLRTREVPDWANYGLFFSALALRIILSVTEQQHAYFTEGLLGFAVMVGLGYLLFYSGQFGGGDVKLLMAMGMLLGLPFNFNATFNSLLFAFVLNSLVVGAIYGVCWSLVLAIRNWRKILKAFHAEFSHTRVRSVRKWGLLAAAALLFGTFLLGRMDLLILALSFVLVYLLMLYSYVFIKAVEQTCMLKQLPVSKLTIGDWIPKDIIIGGKRIVGPKDLGINAAQIAQLQKFAKQRKIKTVLVKEGVPFVPSFCIAFAVTLAWGNLLFLLFSL